MPDKIDVSAGLSSVIGITGSVVLYVNSIEVYESNSVSIPMLFIEMANGIWICSVDKKDVTITIMGEPVIKASPRGDCVNFCEVWGGEPLDKISIDASLNFRDFILQEIEKFPQDICGLIKESIFM